METDKKKCEIFNYCRNDIIDICERCILRLLGISFSSKCFLETGSELSRVLYETVNGVDFGYSEFSKHSTSKICCACLGILDQGCSQETITHIINSIIGQGYVFNTFQVHVAIPAVILLRNAIIMAKLKAHLKKCDISGSFENVFNVKDTWKQILCVRLSEATSARYEINSRFQITINFGHSENGTMQWASICEKNQNIFNPVKCRKSMKPNHNKTSLYFNNAAVLRLIEIVEDKELQEQNLEAPTNLYTIDKVECEHNAIYLVGRYNKFSRNLSQTPWIIDGRKIMETSVQEIIQDVVMKYIEYKQTRFSACGREDVDVKMLGSGRPFVLELINPKKMEIAENIFRTIENILRTTSELVNLRDLQLSTKEDVSKNLKIGETSKQKEYRALCCFSRQLLENEINILNATKDIEIFQKTPIRVLHRRSLATRTKIIHNIRMEEVKQEKAFDGKLFNVFIMTQSGTYVKEFIHGDFGRTIPNVATIVGDVEADIIELDVTDICFSWPPTK